MKIKSRKNIYFFLFITPSNINYIQACFQLLVTINFHVNNNSTLLKKSKSTFFQRVYKIVYKSTLRCRAISLRSSPLSSRISPQQFSLLICWRLDSIHLSNRGRTIVGHFRSQPRYLWGRS